MKQSYSAYILLVCFLLLGTSTIQAQTLSQKEITQLVKKGRKATRDLEYWKAKTYYDKATTGGSRDPQHWFEAGAVYFDSKVEREKSLSFFQEAINLSFTDTIPELLNYMGDAYHFVGEFEKAISYYNLFRKDINPDASSTKELQKELIRKIEICNNGIDLSKQRPLRYVEVANMGDNINTNAADYSSVLTKEEDVLLFCSRRPLASKKSIDGEYYEDIYYSTKTSDTWTNAKVIDKSSGYINKEINGGKSHEAPISMSPDGNTLYIYKENSIWKSEKNGAGSWGIPIKMNRNVNIGKSNHSIFITPDNKEMFIVAVDAEGSLGGRDIYISTANEDGSWGTPVNAGPKINTEYNEDAPFLSSDGKSFYFASTGHNTMGGYDIFKIERDEDGNWGDPINVGAPINSSANDIFYVENAEGSIAYFSSLRPGSYGYMDLYTANFECENIPTTNIKGYSIYAETHAPVSGVIKITNKESGEEMGTFLIDPKTGKYNMVLPPAQTYILELVTAQQGIELTRAHTEEFHVPAQCETYNLFQQISISNVKNERGDILAQTAKFQNAMFDIETEVKAKYDLDEIVPNNTSFVNSNAGIKGTLAHNSTLNAGNIEVTLMNLDNEIIRVTKTDMYGNFAFEKINPKDDYIVLINEEDAIRSYKRSAVGSNDTEEKVEIQGFVHSYGENTEKAKDRTSIYIADNQNEIKSNAMSNEKGYFELTNTPKNASEVASINENTTISYNMDIPTEEVLFSAYLVNIDPNNNQIVYSEYIDMVDLKEVIENTDIADNTTTTPLVEDPIVENDPVVKDPVVVEDPIVVNDPVVKDPVVVEDPIVVNDPVVKDPVVVEDPIVVNDPVVKDPIVVNDPVVKDPVVVEDPIVVNDPVVKDPIVVEDPIVVNDPVVKDPVVVVEDPIVVNDPVVQNNQGEPSQDGEFSNLYFDFDKYFLRDKSKNVLENIYEYLRDHPNSTLRLDGYTDWIGTEEYNTTLSQVRTLVAYKYLIEKGIAPNRLDNAWFGESNPAVSNTNPDGSDSPKNRQLNRRVEIKLDIPEMSALYIQL
ncbi:hypothetical protein DNU06_05235 [Putridiphycobacter roseus]|uniref:OmpA-like domain-containing protein n=1 Tax=Putridiphycobacter roseus TaxID=2219161 RepID=A0A2W1NQU3_9FLAO|nr:OmpA family protein [Putridiphycobacter roseus]PZE18022.1 hypothetical protein DNU06_05235 [Putridiphycobacter roseus]